MSKLLYIVKFSTKKQLYSDKACEYFYNPKKANDLVDKFRTDDYYWATLHTIQPEE